METLLQVTAGIAAAVVFFTVYCWGLSEVEFLIRTGEIKLGGREPSPFDYSPDSPGLWYHEAYEEHRREVDTHKGVLVMRCFLLAALAGGLTYVAFAYGIPALNAWK